MITVRMARKSETGSDLARALLQYPQLNGVVNWTGAPSAPEALNSRSRTNKLEQLIRLDHQRVPVPPYATSKPSGLGWLAREAYHQQGFDLRRPPKRPDYWVKKLNLSEEWRLHFFRTGKGNYRLLRSAKRVPQEGARKVHPWIRSHRLGWKLSYVGGASPALVEAGRRAMEALQLDFGAVDLATLAGEPLVLEVNTCPGLEGGTLDRYVQAIVEHFTPKEKKRNARTR